MKLSLPMPKINVAEFPNRKELTMTMYRIQEYYESPFLNIRNKVFSVEEFIDTHMDNNGFISYFHEWNGFNVSGKILNSFFRIFPVTERERDLLNAITEHVNLKDEYYLIAILNNDKLTLKHEYAHALWLIDPLYQNTAKMLIGDILIKHHRKMTKTLLRMGYDQSVVDDEINAYLSTSSKNDLIDMFDIEEYDEIKNIVRKLKKLFKEKLQAHELSVRSDAAEALEKAFKRGDRLIAKGIKPRFTIKGTPDP